MKFLIYILLALVFISCGNDQNKTVIKPEVKTGMQDSATDSILTFHYQKNFSHKHIQNNSGKQVALLFNNSNDYFGMNKNDSIFFPTECLQCEQVYEYKGGLLFANQLHLLPNELKYYQKAFKGTPGKYIAKEVGERRKKTFKFSEGKGSIQLRGISCNDADFYKVQLNYPSGNIIIDSFINASFFEYDIDNNGQMEQYLVGTRNCDQEVIILQVKQ